MTRAAVRDVAKARSRVGDTLPVDTDVHALVRDPAIDIVVELIGGDTLARELVLEAIANGKHVVTANKALLAKHGNEIFAAAHERGVMVAFEAAGRRHPHHQGHPRRPDRQPHPVGRRHHQRHHQFHPVRDAHARPALRRRAGRGAAPGYAEADPTFDVEGVDAAHKLTLLASLAFGVPVQFDRAYIEGISQLAAEDIELAERLGYRIKLLGITKRRAEGIELRVHPRWCRPSACWPMSRAR